MSTPVRKVGKSGNPNPQGNKGKGRPKGVPNKTTKAAKQAIEEAFKGLGGVAALQRWAEKDPEAFYTKVWVKILPLSVNANVASVPLTDEERRAIIAEAFASGR